MSERKNLEFTYERPSGELPILGQAGPGEPCAFVWIPDFNSEQLTRTTGSAISGNAAIPWDDASIHEIHVQSHYALEILSKMDFPAWAKPLVRILPTESDYTFSEDVKNIHHVGIFCEPSRLKFCCEIAGRVGVESALFVGDAPIDAFPLCSICVFPSLVSCGFQHLALAQAAGAKIVTSDAGAAIEWLTINAGPGEWLVVHDQTAAQYSEAVKYLSGAPSTFGAICKP